MAHLFSFSLFLIHISENKIYTPDTISEVHRVFTLIMFIHLHTKTHVCETQIFTYDDKSKFYLVSSNVNITKHKFRFWHTRLIITQ